MTAELWQNNLIFILAIAKKVLYTIPANKLKGVVVYAKNQQV